MNDWYNFSMPRTDVDEKIVVFSNRSTIGDLIEGINYLRFESENNPSKISLMEAIKYVIDSGKFKINVRDWDEVTKFLKSFEKDTTIEKAVLDLQEIGKHQIEEAEIIVEKDELQSDLNKMRLDDLVKDYEKAQDEREREKIIQEIAKKEKVEINEVMKMIRRQQEIAREQAVLRDKDLEKLDEKNEVKNIAKNEKISVDEAKVVLDQAKMAEAKIRVDNFVENIVKNSEQTEYGNLIRVEMNKVITGEKSKIELPKAVNPVATKKIELEINKFVKENPNTVRQKVLGEVNKEFDIAVANAPTENERRQIREYQQLITEFHNVRGPQILTDKSRKDVESKLESQGKSPGEINNALYNVDATLKSVQHTPDQFRSIIERAKGVATLSRKLLPNSPMIRDLTNSFDNLVSNFNQNPLLYKFRDASHLKVNVLNFATKIPGVNTLLVGAGEALGYAAAKDFILLSTEIMAQQGTIPGAIAIFKAITTGAGVLESGAVGVEGISTLSSALAAFQGVPGIGQIILVLTMIVVAGMWIYNHIIKPVFEGVNNWSKNNLNLNLMGIRDFVADKMHLGKFAGTLAQGAFNGMMFGGLLLFNGMAMLFGPILTIGLGYMTALIAPVVISLAGGMMAYNLLVDMPKISSLVPPPPQALGGSCEPKEDVGEPPVSDGEVNCNQNAPEGSASISKEEFVKKANAWRLGGRNYARECYNDVVNRAKCAGVNPDYALAVWLHESGASNYGIANVEDFGIHGQADAPPKNFDKQITKFLSLKLGQFCPGMEYWLSFSTNFLTGTCDAQRAMICQNQSLCGGKSSEEMNIMVAGGILKLGVDVQNGTSYRSVFVDTFRLMDIAVPASATIPKGGQNCGGSSANPGVAEGENEFVAADGTVMVCSGPVDSEGNFIGIPGESAYDPNAPGLEGELIPGASCSVAHLVVDTKQCGQSWSNKALPGGSGTICSAGCGPSSASSILRNKNGSMTPDTVIFEPGSAYAGMFNDGSSLGQADTTLKKYGYSTSGVQDCTQTDIANWIREGKAVVLLSHSDTGNGSTIGHILVAVAIDSSGKIFTKDPYYSNNTPFSTKGKGNIKVLRSCLPVQLGNKCQGQIKSQ